MPEKYTDRCSCCCCCCCCCCCFNLIAVAVDSVDSRTVIQFSEDVLLVEFMYLVFTRMPGESYRRGLGFLLLCFCDVFRALINSIVLICRQSTQFGGIAFGTCKLLRFFKGTIVICTYRCSGWRADMFPTSLCCGLVN